MRSVMREIVSPLPGGLRRIPETGDQAGWIFFSCEGSRSRPGWFPARPQPGSLAGMSVDPGTGPGFALVPCHPGG
jgi:hypothetical protein